MEDLDELLLRCRDQNARQYVGEAIASYRAGAIRSAIVASWIAVCFDVIEKLRELSLSGDRAAEKHVQEIENTRRSGDISRALKFERELLSIAKDEFDLISPLEYVDLERLQADRNRCAHPSLIGDDQAYAPSAELARLHIHSVVIHLLQHPPVQGKYALERLLHEVESEYFPTDVGGARVAFTSGPLRRPRESLVRNFVLVLVKALLKDQPDYKRRMRVSAALQAVQILHPAPYATTLRDRLSDLFRGIPDKLMPDSIYFLRAIPDSWQFLTQDVRQRIENYVRVLPETNIDEMDFLLEYEPLKQQARRRTQTLSRDQIMGALFFEMPSEIVDRFINLYLESRSFDEANSIAKDLSIYSMDCKAEHIRRIVSSVNQNDQVRGSFQLGGLVENLRSRRKLTDEEFEALLRDNGLGEYAV